MKIFIFLLLFTLISCRKKACEEPPYLNQYHTLLDKAAMESAKRLSKSRDANRHSDTIIELTSYWLYKLKTWDTSSFKQFWADSSLIGQPSEKNYHFAFSLHDTAIKYFDDCERYKAALSIKNYKLESLKKLEHYFLSEYFRENDYSLSRFILGKDTFYQLSKVLPTLKMKLYKFEHTESIKMPDSVIIDNFGFYLIDTRKLKKGMYYLEIENAPRGFMSTRHFKL